MQIINKHQDKRSLLEKTHDHNFDGIVSGHTGMLFYYNYHFFRQGITSLKMMEQKTQFLPHSFVFYRYNNYIHECNEIIRRLRDAGITEYWNNFYFRKEKIDDFGPEVLTLYQLELGFYACMIPMLLPFFAFFCEMSSGLMAYCLNKLKKSILKLLTCR